MFTTLTSLAVANCQLSEWSDWDVSSCGVCKEGESYGSNPPATRMRTILTAPTSGGIACDTKLLETQECYRYCPNKLGSPDLT